MFEAESARWIVELHGRATEVREDDIRAFAPGHFIQSLSQTGKVHPFDHQCVRFAIRPQSRLRAHDLDGILIETEQSASGLDRP